MDNNNIEGFIINFILFQILHPYAPDYANASLVMDHSSTT